MTDSPTAYVEVPTPLPAFLV